MKNKIKSQLYLLQLENYDIARFLKILLKRKFKVFDQPRQELIWTGKILAICFISAGLFLLLTVFIWNTAGRENLFWFCALFAVAVLLSYNFFGFLAALAVLILWPADLAAKEFILFLAKNKANKYSNLTVIGITGSYGKTTIKEVLAGILAEKFKVLKSEENKNTALGIARLILNELDESVDVLILEMGAYRRGDIKKLCRIIQPNFSVLTGINESHLERFGSLENTVKAKFEIIANVNKDAKIILNADDERVVKNYQRFLGGRQTFFYGAAYNYLRDYQISNRKFFTDGSGQSAELSGLAPIGLIKTPFLGEYIFGDIIAGIIIARELGLTVEQIRRGISRLKPIEHRLQSIKGKNDVLVIDDSYNGNSNGVKEAIKTLANFKNRRKIYITPGLVETGGKIKEAHYNIGKQLSKVADKVILIKNSATPHIEQGLLENGFDKKNIICFDGAASAHAGIKNITKAGDVVLFQNDWPDNYL
ncbi:hypothetical protein COU00_00645 [Candidatus Falkowbacteria bacterium CG10_big_fil_rev_8_21_14_0_10_43_11]|uniref:UDP-N-acetylmuramoyl-tripeptide--D-alanyl-D-alanine ligase n=1 Tax=Candidatus Falkowbacteria bacterium CG10_big_fil_rev_8_21_14_0_10_43_11 TaxID=1974568 RepID=A0A2M6WN06_9BACT|nr:MAG: hypothetical protein COU00_00645 [Candidatus Falkowbacteria bacterium CG10_big_fil_rev_8_21_14_0_10_43_11]